MTVATTDHCNGCGAEVEPQEEGRCAFCRADDRGDDQLLAHDSRGYLDVDGKTRIPCGCGCGKAPILDVPRDPLLDVVRDIVGHGERVEIRLPEMPVKWRREWIERLGGVIVIDPDAVMPLAMQRDKNGGREALDAMDRGEPQRAERSEMANGRAGKGPKPQWTEDEALNAIRAFAEEYGRPPTIDGTRGYPDVPGPSVASRLFGSWPNMIEAAGFPRPSRGINYSRSTVPRPPISESEPEPIPETTRPAADLEPIAPPPLPAPRDPDKVDVFDLLGSVVTPELIAWHEEEAKRHLLKVKALRAIREQLEAVG
jgi:hypothetical protein